MNFSLFKCSRKNKHPGGTIKTFCIWTMVQLIYLYIVIRNSIVQVGNIQFCASFNPCKPSSNHAILKQITPQHQIFRSSERLKKVQEQRLRLKKKELSQHAAIKMDDVLQEAIRCIVLKSLQSKSTQAQWEPGQELLHELSDC